MRLSFLNMDVNSSHTSMFLADYRVLSLAKRIPHPPPFFCLLDIYLDVTGSFPLFLWVASNDCISKSPSKAINNSAHFARLTRDKLLEEIFLGAVSGEFQFRILKQPCRAASVDVAAEGMTAL